jgi:peptide/nickel transport system substrate-binding protein
MAPTRGGIACKSLATLEQRTAGARTSHALTQVIQALFQGPNCVLNTVNYGCYDNATVNSLITQAEGAPSISAAGTYWHQADMQIMSDAAIVPILDQNFAVYSSARVRGVASNGQTYPTAIFAPNIGAPDITTLWLARS